MQFFKNYYSTSKNGIRGISSIEDINNIEILMVQRVLMIQKVLLVHNALRYIMPKLLMICDQKYILVK